MKKVNQDRIYVDRLLSGDANALRRSWKSTTSRSMPTAYNIVKNHNDAQEITQDVFTIHRKIHTFKGNSSFYTWIYRITVNYAFMKLRSRRKRAALHRRVLASRTGTRRCSPRSSRTRRVRRRSGIEREFLDKVLQSVEQLPDKYRKVFHLRDIKQYSNEEVGEMLQPERGRGQVPHPSRPTLPA